MKDTEEGQARLKRQVDRENEYISRFMESMTQESRSRRKRSPPRRRAQKGGMKEHHCPWRSLKYQYPYLKDIVVLVQAENDLPTIVPQSVRK